MLVARGVVLLIAVVRNLGGAVSGLVFEESASVLLFHANDAVRNGIYQDRFAQRIGSAEESFGDIVTDNDYIFAVHVFGFAEVTPALHFEVLNIFVAGARSGRIHVIDSLAFTA